MGKHMKKTLLAIAISSAAVAAHADYQFEAGLSYGQGEVSIGNAESDYDTTGVAGRFHFEMVNTSKGPQAEAAFLSKSSSVGFAWDNEDIDEAPDDEDEFAFDVRVVTANNLIVQAAYSEADDGDDTSDTISIGLGTYLNASTDLVVSFETEDDDGENTDELSIELHNVTALTQGASVAYDASVAYVDSDALDDSGYLLAAEATYYVNNSLGFGIAAMVGEVGDLEVDGVAVSASYFPQPNIELTASYTDVSADGPQDFEQDGFEVGAALRF